MVFEFNFCKLNKNCKRNIILRAGSEELIDAKSNRSTIIELGTGYVITKIKIGNQNMNFQI